jgi:hypothetical protein
MKVTKRFLIRIIREEIKRTLLTEVAEGPQNLPPNVKIVIDASPRRAHIYYVTMKDDGSQKYEGLGEIIILVTGRPSTGPCSSAWRVVDSRAEHGWGPMLYDVTMEWATLNGGGLVSDRETVSPEARKVWDYYLRDRSDVENYQLDNLKNVLTPEIEEDNCSQRAAGWDDNAIDPRDIETDWIASALSKLYTKTPTTMDALDATGQLHVINLR